MNSLPPRSHIPDAVDTPEYDSLIARLRAHIVSARAQADRAINTELVLLYWTIGHEIVQQQTSDGWGDGVVARIASDLSAETGSSRGFSRRNLFYMRRFAQLWPDPQLVQTLSALVVWSHHQVLLDAFPDQREIYAWYATKASEGRWSVRYLKGQIDLQLHKRQGAAINNFMHTLERTEARNALEATKDPYIFDFLELDSSSKERHLEQALIDDIQKLLLELGTGFAFYGRQKAIVVGGREFFLDLIFYHHFLRRFVVVELKIGEFQPEFISKMNLYLNAVDEQLRAVDDKESIGILLCTSRDETVAKLALHRVYAPIAVSTWRTDTPPELPSVEITERIPEDLDELAELDVARKRLLESVARRTREITMEDNNG